jgi:hypothetical protein
VTRSTMRGVQMPATPQRWFELEAAIKEEISKLALLELEIVAQRMREAGFDPLVNSVREYAASVVKARETARVVDEATDVETDHPLAWVP